MDIKKETPSTSGMVSGVNTFQQHKDSTVLLKNKVLSEFLSGRKVTAKQLNEMFYFNDARKIISILRRSGFHIVDRILPTRCKEYWLLPDTQQQIEF